jgi:hypothetical protein
LALEEAVEIVDGEIQETVDPHRVNANFFTQADRDVPYEIDLDRFTAAPRV